MCLFDFIPLSSVHFIEGSKNRKLRKMRDEMRWVCVHQNSPSLPFFLNPCMGCFLWSLESRGVKIEITSLLSNFLVCTSDCITPNSHGFLLQLSIYFLVHLSSAQLDFPLSTTGFWSVKNFQTAVAVFHNPFFLPLNPFI